jgi:hypothetical protein
MEFRPVTEYGRLRRLVHEQGWRLHKGERDGVYVLTDGTNAIEAESLTSDEVRRRRPARSAPAAGEGCPRMRRYRRRLVSFM